MSSHAPLAALHPVQDILALPPQILRTFFKLIFGTILFSLLTGLMVLPVVLSLIGPKFVGSAIAEPAAAAALPAPGQEGEVDAGPSGTEVTGTGDKAAAAV